MPSPRSVLIDLDKHGLNYNKAHSIIGADGRLKPSSAVGGVAVSEEVTADGSDLSESDKKQKHKKLKSGLVELADKPVDEVKATTDDDSAKAKQKPIVVVAKKSDVKPE